MNNFQKELMLDFQNNGMKDYLKFASWCLANGIKRTITFEDLENFKKQKEVKNV